MKEGNPQYRFDQDRQFINWYSKPENMQAVGQIWSQKWEEEYWSKDEPGDPLTPQEQAQVDTYYPLIINALEVSTEIFNGYDEADRQRAVSDWEGMGALLGLYNKTSGKDRKAIKRAMGKVIETAEQNPEQAAEVLYTVTSLGLSEVEGSIKRLAKQPIAIEHEALSKEIARYKATRIFHTLTYEKTREIYQQLTNLSEPQIS